MAFYEIPVVSGKVASTQTNFPVYIKPSAITGLPTLTLAEAQSSRWYSDEAKTTELAREIVSADEIHVKVPSLTTTTSIYVDYDGVRADYAVGATYGRNAVWSDYAAVFHMETDLTDSTGNTTAGTTTGANYQTEAVGNGVNLDGINDYLTLNRISAIENVATLNHQLWHRSDLGTDMELWGNGGIGSANNLQAYYENTTVTVYFAVKSINNRFVYPVTNMTAEQLYKWDIVYDGSLSGNSNRLKLYQDGVNVTANGSFVGTIEATTTTATGDITLGKNPASSNFYLDGAYDEMRFRVDTPLSANWITTEYNNQSDVGAFWGTATEIVDTATGAFFTFF